MPDTRTYATTPESLEKLSALLAVHGVVIDAAQPAGRTATYSWDIGWSTPEPNHTFITVYKHPFAKEGFLWGKLQGVLGDPA